jgi:DNA polymerase elongation subunit (family B)
MGTFEEKIKAPKSYKDEAKIKEYIKTKKKEARKKMSVDPDYCEIICIGLKELGKDPKLVDLSELYDILNNDRIITFNGKKFDIPCLIKAGIKNNINLPFLKLSKMMGWSYEYYHVDLLELLGNKDYKSLDEYCQIYLGKSKTPIDFEKASEEEIKAHCLEDLYLTESLYNKFKVLI